MDERFEGKSSVLIETKKEVDLEAFSNIQRLTNPEIERKEKAKTKLFQNVSFVERETDSREEFLRAQKISLKAELESAREREPEVYIRPNVEYDLNATIDKYLEEETETKTEVCEEIQQDAQENVAVEEETLEETFAGEEIESEGSVKVVYQNAKKKNLKLRLKLAACAVLCVLTCLGGWAIYNATQIKTLTAEAQAKQYQYQINVVTVASNISKLDDLTNPNSITNLDELEKANIVEIIPRETVAPQALEKQSNWFDRVCNWLSNLFK